MRRLTGFVCEGAWCAATLDTGDSDTGLLIVSGGNEIRSGAHAGYASLAAHFATQGHSVFRYDRRGIGESEGANAGFESSAADIAAAIAAFRAEMPNLRRLVAFGNCDAASALALFHQPLAIDHLVLANPWVIEAAEQDTPAPISPAAIRSRYWARLKNPRSLIDLLMGKVDMSKLAVGLARATQKDGPSDLAQRISGSLAASSVQTTILLAKRDTTAMAFASAWNSSAFSIVRQRSNIALHSFDSASHSFADAQAKQWLIAQIEKALAS